MGRPVLPPRSLPGAGTDGPFTVAFKLRGATELCLDIYEDPKYVHDLLSFITEATIQRIRAVRQYLIDKKDVCSEEFETPGWGFADDERKCITGALPSLYCPIISDWSYLCRWWASRCPYVEMLATFTLCSSKSWGQQH